VTGYEKEPSYGGPPVKRWELPIFVVVLVAIVLVALCGKSRAEGEIPTKLTVAAAMSAVSTVCTNDAPWMLALSTALADQAQNDAREAGIDLSEFIDVQGERDRVMLSGLTPSEQTVVCDRLVERGRRIWQMMHPDVQARYLRDWQ